MRVNPSHIQAYRTMALQIRPNPVQSEKIDTARTASSARRGKLEIEGSAFASYLSKAEKQFIVEKFSGSNSSPGGIPEEIRGRTLGNFLDIKA